MRKRILSLAIGLFLISISLTAQTAAYFMDGVAVRNNFNPAFDSERNYFSVPVVGMVGGNYTGNVSLGDFVMPRTVDGTQKTVTFLHPQVSLADLTFSDRNKLSEQLFTQVLGAGFHAWGGFTTIAVNVREEGSINLPGELFTMMKELKNRDYVVGDADVHAQSWAELAVGHSRQVNKHLRVGGKVKLLLGLARGKASFSDLHFNLVSQDQWTVSGKAQVDVSCQDFTWGEPQTKTYKSTGESYECVDWDNVDWGDRKVSVAGGGLAIDLGAEYACKGLLSGLNFSAALTDLGFLRWDNTRSAANMGQPFTFDGFHDIRIKGHEGDVPFREQGNQLLDDLAQFYTVQELPSHHTVSTFGTTLNVGVAYALPFYKRLKLGLLSTSRLQGKHSWNEERLSVNLCPADFLELSVSGAAGTLGKSWGCVLNIKPKYFNLFVGMDHYFGNLAKPCIPMGKRANVYLGMNITY